MNHRDDAVSNVIGSIMVLALMTASFVLIETQHAPVWEQRQEQVEAVTALESLVRVKTGAELQLVNRSVTPVSSLLPLGKSEEGRFFTTSGFSGELSFDPSTSAANLTSSAMSLFRKDGKPLGRLNEDWEGSTGTSNVTGIGDVDSLRIRLTSPTIDKFELKKKSFISLRFTDANGAYGGDYRAYVPEKDKEDVWARVTSASGEVLFDQEIISDAKYKEHNQMWLDVLDPSLPMRELMDALDAPFGFELTYDFPELDPNKWPEVEYAVTYQQVTADGDVIFVGTGGTQAVSDFRHDRDGGRIAYTLRTAHMPAQTLVLEHGGILRVQSEGSALVAAPSIFLRRSGDTLLFDASMPSLHGASKDISKTGSATVSVRGGKASEFTGTTPSFSLRFESEYPNAWRVFFEDLARGAGLTFPEGYSVDVSSGAATLTLNGFAADANAHDIQVHMREAPITIEFDR